jgi:hypothetical protein
MNHRCLLPAIALAMIIPSPAPAQFAYDPGAAFAFGQTQGLAWTPGANLPVFGFSPWANWGNSAGGFLNGAAGVISASGQYEMMHQQARLTRQQVKAAHIENRRRMFDELRYERENTPPLSANLEEDRQEQVRQALANPQLTDIWSGNALNVLLTEIQIVQSRTGLQGATVPLEPDAVRNLSLTTGTTPGSIGLLRGGKLRWPPELQGERFQKDIDAVNKLLPEMIQQAQGSGVTGQAIRQMDSLLASLREEVTAAVDDMSPSDNIRAMRFVRDLSQATRLLRDPNVAKQLGGAWQPQGETVGELVSFMTSRGLRFAPAARGDEAFYTALHQAMAMYVNSLRQLKASPGLTE